jgi:hypothetical protein
MRSLALIAAAGLWLAPSWALAGEKAGPSKYTEPSGSCGTSLDFFDSPKEAARQAEKDQKLVFVVHVSGVFEDPKLT